VSGVDMEVVKGREGGREGWREGWACLRRGGGDDEEWVYSEKKYK